MQSLPHQGIQGLQHMISSRISLSRGEPCFSHEQSRKIRSLAAALSWLHSTQILRLPGALKDQSDSALTLFTFQRTTNEMTAICDVPWKWLVMDNSQTALDYQFLTFFSSFGRFMSDPHCRTNSETQRMPFSSLIRTNSTTGNILTSIRTTEPHHPSPTHLLAHLFGKRTETSK